MFYLRESGSVLIQLMNDYGVTVHRCAKLICSPAVMCKSMVSVHVKTKDDEGNHSDSDKMPLLMTIFLVQESRLPVRGIA